MNEELYKKLHSAASLLIQTELKKVSNTKSKECSLFLPLANFTAFSLSVAFLINIFFGQHELFIPFIISTVINLILIIVNIILEKKQTQLSIVEYYNLKSAVKLTQTEELYSEYFIFLPKEYRNIHAILYMLNLVENLSASTLKEALGKYETHLKDLNENYREQKYEKMYCEQIEMLSKFK